MSLTYKCHALHPICGTSCGPSTTAELLVLGCSKTLLAMYTSYLDSRIIDEGVPLKNPKR